MLFSAPSYASFFFENDIWTEGPTVPYNRILAHLVVLTDNQVLFYGGLISGVAKAESSILHLDTLTWHNQENMKHAWWGKTLFI